MTRTTHHETRTTKHAPRLTFDVSRLTFHASRFTFTPPLTAFWLLVGYAFIVVLMTWPSSLHLSHRLIGNNMDDWIFYWNNWWLERAIVEGHDWFFTPYLFYPQGTSLVAHSNSFLNSLLAFAIKPLVGPVAAYNLVLLFGLWIGAVGMFLLVHDLTHYRPAAFLAGFIFAFAPYHLTQTLAHAHLGSIHWWPFYALFLRRALRRKRALDALCAGLFAALTLWSGLQLAVLLMLWTAAYVGWHVLSRRDPHTRCLYVIGIVGLVALVLSAPVVIPVLRGWREVTDKAVIFDEGMSGQTDLLAYLLPPAYHPLVGSHVLPLYDRFVNNREYMPYLGYAALGLAILSLLPQRKEARFWLLSTGFWIVLAAGSALRLNGTVYPHIPLPYRFIGHLFPISAMRMPDRFNLLVAFSLAVSAGLGTAQLTRRRRWLLPPLALLILIEYLCVPIPMLDLPTDSPFFERVARDEARYGVVNYPMGYTVSKQWLYYQTLHGKPMIEGHVSRYTTEHYAFIHTQPLLRALYRGAERPRLLPPDEEAPETDAYVPALGPALRSLDAHAVRYVLVHKPYVDAYLQEQFERILPIVPIYEDETLAVYDVRHPLPYSYDGLPFPLTPDVALVRFDVQPPDADARWRLRLMARLSAPRIGPLPCQVRLEGEDREVLTLPIRLFDTDLSDGEKWQTGDLWVKEMTTSLPADLEPRAYHWTLACGEETRYEATDTLEIYPDGHTVYLRRSTDLIYGDVIRLLGYRWWTTGADLHLTLLWEALEKPTADYKVFVHLLNADGDLIRQYDAMPCDWKCPTGQWQAGERITDQATLSLWGLPAGEYRLAVGIYHPVTLERLPVYEPGSEPYPDAYPILPDAFTISSATVQAQ